MYKPTFEEFIQKARQGNLIPVYKEVLADLETPVSAYMKIRQESYSFLLESVQGGERWARYCFLGCNPSTIIRLRGRKITVQKNGVVEEKTISAENPLEGLKEILSRYKPAPTPDLPRFAGGAVGFISYDMARFFERLPNQAADDLDMPDALFMTTDTLLIFDNVYQTIKIVSNAFVENDDLEGLYRSAIGKIEAIEEKLRQNVPEVSLPIPPDEAAYTPRFESNFKKEDFIKAVRKIKQYIMEGDVIQTVLAQRLKLKITRDPFDIYRALRAINPSPYMYFLSFGEFQIVGSSPEALVRQEGRLVENRPIAGTRRRGKSEDEDLELERELLKDEKELAEHIMLVDLGRNDLGRIAEPSTVEVNEKFLIERYSHVMHIVSNVRCVLKKGYDCFDVLKAAFPAGTVSGAPKIRAMEIIDELEPTRRGLYAGAVGYISFTGNMDTAIAIRTLVIKDKTAYLGIGAGIVADSDPEREFEETMNKGKALLKAIQLAERGLAL
ncbi:MAG: anthranilate synthase component I [Nitrospinales bacterium]